MRFEDMFSIEGKIALVTGGSQGIGEIIASGMIARGAGVYITSRNAEACRAAADRLRDEHHGECIALPGDISNLAGITKLVTSFSNNEDKLDILVNNAGASTRGAYEEFLE